jgi:O-antigen biosynthesis protein
VISIVIPTYNGISLLRANLAHLIKEVKELDCEIIVVDNGSLDDTANYIKTLPSIQYIRLKKNEGFTGACNAGAHKAKGEYLLFLNNDCVITKGVLEQLLQKLQNDTTIIATQPVVKNIHGEVENIGFWVDTKIGKAQVVTGKKEYEQIRQDKLLYGLSGTCMIIQKEAFLKVGLFNKTFHSYLEDVDLALTLFEKGYSVKPCFEASVIHAHMATSSKMGSYKQQQDIKNWWRILFAHPKLFKLTPKLILERLRNISGLIKSYF